MMKPQTISNLNTTAEILTDMLLTGVKTGTLRRSADEKESSDYERIKKTITMGKVAFRLKCLPNICKTTRQLNYLSNEVLYHLRRQGFFKMVKSVPTAKYVQQYLPLFD